MLIDIIIEKIGFAVCHQLPERCLSFGPILINICARCNGIYLGFFISALLLFALYRKRQSGLPPVWVLIILLLFIASTLVDGLLSYLSVISTNNIVRFITGFLCGASIMAIIYPVFVFQYYRQSTQDRILAEKWKLAVFLGSLGAFIALTLARWDFTGLFFYYLSAFSVAFTFYFINLTVMLLVPPLAQKADRLFSKNLIIPSVSALVLASLELYAFYLVHGLAQRIVLQVQM
ncbi:MAG: DUF2085 domain-containing protein [Actinomycetia bacterium]|nr:DUF2085 domain-containing protein [Actinomycetes bacterium]